MSTQLGAVGALAGNALGIQYNPKQVAFDSFKYWQEAYDEYYNNIPKEDNSWRVKQLEIDLAAHKIVINKLLQRVEALEKPTTA